MSHKKKRSQPLNISNIKYGLRCLSQRYFTLADLKKIVGPARTYGNFLLWFHRPFVCTVFLSALSPTEQRHWGRTSQQRQGFAFHVNLTGGAGQWQLHRRRGDTLGRRWIRRWFQQHLGGPLASIAGTISMGALPTVDNITAHARISRTIHLDCFFEFCCATRSHGRRAWADWAACGCSDDAKKEEENQPGSVVCQVVYDRARYPGLRFKFFPSSEDDVMNRCCMNRRRRRCCEETLSRQTGAEISARYHKEEGGCRIRSNSQSSSGARERLDFDCQDRKARHCGGGGIDNGKNFLVWPRKSRFEPRRRLQRGTIIVYSSGKIICLGFCHFAFMRWCFRAFRRLLHRYFTTNAKTMNVFPGYARPGVVDIVTFDGIATKGPSSAFIARG